MSIASACLYGGCQFVLSHDVFSSLQLSCIDCGVVFDRYSVQGHTSCVTEEVRWTSIHLTFVMVSAFRSETGKGLLVD